MIPFPPNSGFMKNPTSHRFDPSGATRLAADRSARWVGLVRWPKVERMSVTVPRKVGESDSSSAILRMTAYERSEEPWSVEGV